MMKIKLVFLLTIALGCAVAVNAQAPAEGRITANAYVNPSLHIAYAWPAIVKPVKLAAASAERNDPHAYQYVLFSAKEGDQPYGVLMLAQRLGVAGPHSAGLKSSAEMIAHLADSLRPGPVLTNIARSQHTAAGGRRFDELTYAISGKPAAVIATQVGQYLIVFKCNAQSAHDLALMEKSVLALRVGK